jgi:hypothetical protein
MAYLLRVSFRTPLYVHLRIAHSERHLRVRFEQFYLSSSLPQILPHIID